MGAAPVLDALDELAQLDELRAAADERRARGSRARARVRVRVALAQRERLPRAHRLRLALQRERLGERAVLDRVARRAVGFLADDHAARGRRGLQARGAGDA